MDIYNEDDMPAPYVGDWAARYAPHEDPPNPSLWHGDLGIQQAKKSRQGYYGSITFIDEQIGQILAALRKRGTYDNTLIIFFSDFSPITVSRTARCIANVTRCSGSAYSESS